MTTSTTYSIVGSGNVGSALARLFARAHIDVTIANTRGPESLRELTAELGPAVQAATITDAIERDVIFIPIPFHTVEAFGRTLSDWTGKIIVDTTNSFYTPNAEAILQGRLSSEFVAEAFPGAELVKAFNQLPAKVLSAQVPPAHGKRVVFVSSNSEASSAVIAQLSRDLGLAPVELGRIDEGGRLIQAQKMRSSYGPSSSSPRPEANVPPRWHAARGQRGAAVLVPSILAAPVIRSRR